MKENIFKSRDGLVRIRLSTHGDGRYPLPRACNPYPMVVVELTCAPFSRVRQRHGKTEWMLRASEFQALIEALKATGKKVECTLPPDMVDKPEQRRLEMKEWNKQRVLAQGKPWVD